MSRLEEILGLRIKHSKAADIIKRIEEVESSSEGKLFKHRLNHLKKYFTKYERLTRGPLSKEDPSLYRHLTFYNLLKYIPKKKFPKYSLKYYQKHHNGVSSTELFKLNRQLWNVLYRNGEIKYLPHTVKHHPNALKEYNEKYSGMTRYELQKENQSLYNCLWRMGLLEHVPMKSKPRTYYGDDPLAYYHEHFLGVTRAELQKIKPGLYNRLYRMKLLSEVPLKIEEENTSELQ